MPDLPESAIPHFNVQTMTPEDAAKRLECPLARVMHKAGENGMCKGAKCAVWRFLPMLASDPPIVSAIQREMAAIAEERGDKKPAPSTLHKEAVARVMRDPSAYAIPAHHERGYCGFGGRP